MTPTTFATDLAARARNLFAIEKTILAVASDALDAVGMTAEQTMGVRRRFVAPGPPQWEASMLCVHPTKVFVGQAGAEEYAFPVYGDGVLGLRTVSLTVLLVTSGYPTKASGPRAALDDQSIEASAEVLHVGLWAIFLGLIEAHESDQIDPGFRLMLVGPLETTFNPEAGLVGGQITVPIQV